MESKILLFLLLLLSGCCHHKKPTITFYDNGNLSNALIEGEIILKPIGKNVLFKDVEVSK